MKKDVWSPYVTFHTTSEFAGIGKERHIGPLSKLGFPVKGYVQHCGPTAITNLLLTIKNFRSSEELSIETPESLFLKIVKLGQRHLIFYNFRLFNKIGGGTSWFLAGSYLRLSLRKMGLSERTHVSGRILCRPSYVLGQLKRGRIVFAQLYHHPRYGSHDILLYGYETRWKEDPTTGEKSPEHCFLAADGWSRQKVWIPVKDLPVLGGWAVECE